MVFVYDEAAGKGRGARRIYQERYLLRVTPSHTLFAKVIQRIRKRGTFTVNRSDCSCPRRRRNPNSEEDYWIALKRPRQRVTGSLGVEWVCLIIPSGRFWTSSNYTLSNPRGPADFALRADFCIWFLHRWVEESQFPRQVLFTTECRFTRDALFNSRTSHVWVDENLHTHHAHRFQQCFGINVWAGIVDGCLIGPYLLPPRLTGHTYCIFLREVLGELLEDVTVHPSTPLVSTRWRTSTFCRCDSWSR